MAGITRLRVQYICDFVVNQVKMCNIVLNCGNAQKRAWNIVQKVVEMGLKTMEKRAIMCEK